MAGKQLTYSEDARKSLKTGIDTLADVVKITTYLEDARDFGRYNGVFKQYFPDGNVSRTTVEARAVITTGIEMDAVAYKPLKD